MPDNEVQSLQARIEELAALVKHYKYAIGPGLSPDELATNHDIDVQRIRELERQICEARNRALEDAARLAEEPKHAEVARKIRALKGGGDAQ